VFQSSRGEQDRPASLAASRRALTERVQFPVSNRRQLGRDNSSQVRECGARRSRILSSEVRFLTLSHALFPIVQRVSIVDQ
jgi:hypothetical protein